MNVRPDEVRPKNKGGLFIDRAHLPFVAGAFVIAVLGGFSLALALPIDALLRGRNLSWFEHAQVHGHMQAVGFAGFFIIGVSYRMAPRFSGTALAFPRLVAPTFFLLVSGLIARFAGQPVANVEAFGALMALSGWLELAGVACFAATIVATTAPARRRGDPTALLFSAGAVWFFLAASLNALWLTELWRDGGTVLASDRGSAILLIQLLGVHLAFIFGVALRAFPVFFDVDRAPTRRAASPSRSLKPASRSPRSRRSRTSPSRRVRGSSKRSASPSLAARSPG